MGLLSKKIEAAHIVTHTEQLQRVAEQYIKAKAKATPERLEILEAGCGREWWMDLEGVDYRLTGVDLDAEALAARKHDVQDLDVAIVGDLCTIELARDRYDVIFNAYVLEHLKDADAALANFTEWLKPDGLMILLFPDRDSVYGFLTRFTPHWVHVLYLRYLSPWKNKDAGKPGFGPYKTFHESVVSKQGIEAFCKKNGLLIEAEYGSNAYIAQSSPLKAALMKAIVSLTYVLSLGRLEPSYNNLFYVIKKPNRTLETNVETNVEAASERNATVSEVTAALSV